MEILQAIILGLVQGISEFLPVSSSGHLVLFQRYFTSFLSNELLFDIVVHVGTLFSVIIFCWQEVMMMLRATLHIGKPAETEAQAEERRLLTSIIIAMIPTIILGFAAKIFAMDLFGNLYLLAGTFMITSLFLVFSKSITGKTDVLSWRSALVVGFAQGLAVLPGISRSGATIVAGQAAGLKRRTAARFAFVLSIPAIAGAAVFSIIEAIGAQTIDTALIVPMACGMIVASIVGYASLSLLTRIIEKAKLWHFAIYTGLVSLFCLILAIIG